QCPNSSRTLDCFAPKTRPESPDRSSTTGAHPTATGEPGTATDPVPFAPSKGRGLSWRDMLRQPTRSRSLLLSASTLALAAGTKLHDSRAQGSPSLRRRFVAEPIRELCVETQGLLKRGARSQSPWFCPNQSS